MKNTFLLFSILAFQFAYTQRDYTFIYNGDSIIKKGTKLHDAGKYDDAVKEYEKIARSDPQYARAQYEKALSIYSLDDDAKTRAFMKECFDKKIFADEPSFYMIYGSFLSDKKEYDESEKIFKEGVSVIPNSSSLLYNYAILKLRNNDKQGAVDILEKTLTINPDYASAHYFLGIMAMESGHVTEGSLALLAYLIDTPKGRYASKAIDMLNVKMGENYLKKDALKYSASGDDFSDIDEILRNQLPLKKVYKVNSDFKDDPIIRQLQAICEYSIEHKTGDGFFENTYIPMVKKLTQDKQFENMSYYILLSKEEQLGKKLSGKKKEITAFSDYTSKVLWDYFALRKMEHFGKTEPVIVSMKNGYPYVIGAIVNGKKEGKYKVLDEYGKISGELNFKNDELDGLQKYFYYSGQLKTEKECSAGKLNGTKKEYYTNGQLNVVQTYVNDKLNGISASYHVNGGKNCEVNFTDDERDGKLVCTYPNGSPKSEDTYVKGKLNGTHISYNEAGDITEKYVAKDDKIDGNYVAYFDGKIVKEEAVYVDGKINGKMKIYFPNQAVDEDRTYENGNIKHILNYRANGKISSEAFYDDKGKQEGNTYYDADGAKYFEEKYKDDKIVSALQYHNGNPKPTAIKVGKEPYTISSLEGNPIASGYFLSGEKNKEWNYYYSSGVLKSKENYVAGKMQGLDTNYNDSGTLSQIENYKDGKLSGVYENYDNGVMDGVYHFSNGDKNGPYQVIEADGTVSAEGFYEDNEQNYTKTYYRNDGSVDSRLKFINGIEIATEYYRKDGNIDSSINYKDKTETVNSTYNNGLVIQSMQLANGELNGGKIRKDKRNTLISQEEFVNGVFAKNYKAYSPMGSLQLERTYYCGKLHGLQHWYDLAGNMFLEENFLFGSQFGKSTRFYQNHALMCERTFSDDLLDGEITYYNLKGEAILKMGYSNNALTYYIRLGKSGALDDKVPVVKESANIVSAYPNGKTAMSLQIVKGSYEGKMVIASEEGVVLVQNDYLHDISNGEKTEYYPSGKLYKRERLRNGDYEGAQEYFSENGNPIITLNYKNNKLHGDTVIYNAKGKITKTYDSNELVEIK